MFTNESETKTQGVGSLSIDSLGESFPKQEEEVIESHSTGVEVMKNRIQELNVQIKELTDCNSIYEKELNAANKAIKGCRNTSEAKRLKGVQENLRFRIRNKNGVPRAGTQAKGIQK